MHDNLYFTDLKIVSWNIHGIFTRHSGFRYNKLHSPLFKSGLIETHHVATEIDQLQLQGFKCYNVCRKKKRQGRNSGGIAVYVHETISKGVQKIPSHGSENLLLKPGRLQIISDSFFQKSDLNLTTFSDNSRLKSDPKI